MFTLYKLKYRQNGMTHYSVTRNKARRDQFAEDLRAQGIRVECYEQAREGEAPETLPRINDPVTDAREHAADAEGDDTTPRSGADYVPAVAE